MPRTRPIAIHRRRSRRSCRLSPAKSDVTPTRSAELAKTASDPNDLDARLLGENISSSEDNSPRLARSAPFDWPQSPRQGAGRILIRSPDAKTRRAALEQGF